MAYGEAAGAATTLPAGTYVVPMRQAAKHWVEAMLGADPYVPFPYFYDVSSWSNPLLMGLSGGALVAPLAVPASAADRVRPGRRPPAPAADAPGYAFGGGAQASIELALDLLRAGLPVSRRPDGGFAVAGGGGTAIDAAAARGVTLSALDAAPAGGTALTLPRVARLQTGGADTAGGWAAHVLDDRDGLRAPALTGADIAGGALAAYTALVVPDSDTPGHRLAVARGAHGAPRLGVRRRNAGRLARAGARRRPRGRRDGRDRGRAARLRP